MSDMTSKERIVAALAGEPVDHVPFSPFLAYVWESFSDEIVDAGQLEFLQRVGADPLWRGAPCAVRPIIDGIENKNWEDGRWTYHQVSTPVGTLREGWLRSDEGNTNFLVEHRLKTEEDYKVQMWIEEHTRFELNLEPSREHFADKGREGLSLGMLIPSSKSAFQKMIEHQCGTEELIYALADFPETVETLWRTTVERNLEAVRLAVESDYEYFITWEDSGTQNYSPAMYDKYIGSEIGQWCAILAGAGKKYVQHACGHVKDLVARMKDHGAYAVESVSQPPTGNATLRQARESAGENFGIVGGIEPTHFLNLSMDKLGPYVEQVIEDGGGGPFVLANADSCPPGVTLEKFKLAADVAKSSKK
jgi:hypothetical protein